MIEIDTIINIVVAFLLFGFIVLFHEFGHYVVARLCGVRVIEFAVGMGPRLFHTQKKGTIYSLRAFPIGGFCSMLGEDRADETDEKTEESPESPEAIFEKSRGVSLNEKTSLQRLLIVLAGPVFNFILAFFLAILIVSSVGRDSCKLVAVTEGYPAKEAGILPGDTIVSINGKKIVFFRELTQYLQFHPNEYMSVTVSRGEEKRGEHLSFDLMPKYNDSANAYFLGIQVDGARTPVHGASEICYYALHEVRFYISSTVNALCRMIRGTVSAENLTGPIGIVEAIGKTVNETKGYGLFTVLLNLANMGLLLSANLGVMNLLPLPALDGGRIAFCLFELVSRKKINRDVEGYIHFAGFILLMGLMVFALFNDLGRMFG